MACIAIIIQRCFTHRYTLSCRLSPWASQNVSLQSCLACQDCDSECSLRPEWVVVVVQIPFSVDPVQYRPVHPTVDPSPVEKSSIVSTRRFQSSNRSRKYATSKRENDVFVRQITSTNPNTLDEHCVALVPTFSSLQTTMCRLWNPDKNDFRERYDFMSVMLTISLFVRRHSVALRFVSTALPSHMTQQPCPDRFVRAKTFTAAKSHLAIRTNFPRLFLNSLDRTLSTIGC